MSLFPVLFIEKSLETVKNDGYSTNYASNKLQNDRAIVIDTLKIYIDALTLPSVELKKKNKLLQR